MTLEQLRRQLIDEFPENTVVVSMHVHTGLKEPYFVAHFDRHCEVGMSNFAEAMAWLRYKASKPEPVDIDFDFTPPASVEVSQ